MTVEDTLKTLRGSAKFHYDKDSDADLRLSAYAIVDYYKVLMFNVGSQLRTNVNESEKIETKFFKISWFFPEINKYKELVENDLAEVRNKVSHTDTAKPNKARLKTLIDSTESFKNSLEGLIKKKREVIKKKKNAAWTVIYEIELFEHFLDLIVDTGYKDEARIHPYREKLEIYKSLENLDKLDPTTLNGLVGLVRIDGSQLQDIYYEFYSKCPKCGGKITTKTEEKTHFGGATDDPEPTGFSVFQIIGCENCGFILEREHITDESI